MGLYLVVAHQTAASPELLEAVREVMAREPEAEFVLLVPATPVTHLLTWTEGESLEVARNTAHHAAEVLRAVGANLIDRVIGVPDPLTAIGDEMRARGRPYEAAIISTLPLGVSRWLRRDLPTRVRTKLGLEVLHVISQEQAAKRAVA
jgi:hypothetical protein